MAVPNVDGDGILPFGPNDGLSHYETGYEADDDDVLDHSEANGGRDVHRGRWQHVFAGIFEWVV